MNESTQLGAGFFEIIEAERPFARVDLFEARSMLSFDERLALHWATRAGNPSHDAVVDAGCFLGGSTVSLAGGIRARRGACPIHVYDLFIFGSESESVWVPDGFEFGVGLSTLPVFEHQVARVRDMLTLHPGDIRQARWRGGPVGVLFIDIAKSWDTGDAVWREFFPSLVPGESLVVQQDLAHWGHPWCAIVMELLAEHFEYLGWVWYSSAIYRCATKVERDEVPASLLHDLSAGEKLDLLERAARRLGEPIAGSVRLSGAVILASHGQFAAARERVAEIRGSYGDGRIPYLEEGFAYLTGWIDQVEAGVTAVT